VKKIAIHWGKNCPIERKQKGAGHIKGGAGSAHCGGKSHERKEEVRRGEGKRQ